MAHRTFVVALTFVLLLVTRAALGEPPPAAGAPDWNPKQLRAELAKGRPLVVHVRVALCSNRQIDCGSGIAGRAGNLSHNIYWGAIFGARRFLDRKSSGWERLSVTALDDVVLERAVYRRKVPAKRWGLSRAEPIEQLVVLDAVHGDRIDQAVTGFFRSASTGETLRVNDGAGERVLTVQVAGYVGHNRLMDGLKLPEPEAAPSALPSFVLACYSEQYFGAKLRRAGSPTLVMTRQLMAPEGYLLEAVLKGIGDGKTRSEIRAGAVRSYAKWQRLSQGTAAWIFAGK
ncbi:MAG: hypothetical protein IPI67_14710 [Myxococcales bacterium]|nr:hypothetical protein [Myxococcales bacterium]